MADLETTIGRVLRRQRRRRGLTLREVAEKAAVSVVYLGEIERGLKYPSALVLERVGEAVGLALADVLEGVADELRAADRPAVRAIGFRLPGAAPVPPPSPRRHSGESRDEPVCAAGRPRAVQRRPATAGPVLMRRSA